MAVNDNDIALYQRIVDPAFNNLFFLALVQPLCAMMPIAEEQSKWIAAYLKGENHFPSQSQMDRERFHAHEAMKEKLPHLRAIPLRLIANNTPMRCGKI